MYLSEFNKKYSGDEYQIRKSIFQDSLQKILTHNKNPHHTWKTGVNYMTDYTHSELKMKRGVKKELIYKSRMNENNVKPLSVHPDQLKDLPTSVDWRSVPNVVTPVKDQGHCGSCWSFAAAATLESMWAINTGKLVELSEQNILDCTANPHHCGGTGGCGGATAELAFGMVTLFGIATEWTYPYISYNGSNYQCPSKRPPVYARAAGYVTLPSNQYLPLIAAVASIGPIAISVDASSWSHYESGVFDGCNQDKPDIDHAVQLVGYGTDPSLGDYWLVRNSWNPNWGENGYIRLKRETVPRCAVDITPSDGSGCDGGPKQVTVCGTCGILYDSAYPLYNSSLIN